MSKRSLFLFVLLIPNFTFSQVTTGGGTVVIINSTKDEVVVAADSRVVDPSGLSKPQDSYCKIATFDHQIVFSSVGTYIFNAKLGDGLGSWNSFDILGDIVRKNPSNANAPRIGSIAREWSDELVKRWSQAYTVYPDDVMSAARINGGALIGGFFAERSGEQIIQTVAVVLFNPASITPVSEHIGTIKTCWPCGQTEDWSVCVGGKVQITAEFCQRTTARAQDEAKNGTPSKELLDTWGIHPLLALRLADLTVGFDNSGGVGGRIDVVELDKSGIHWLARKPQCPESQN